MGTTFANLHVLDGDEQQIRTIFPKAEIGSWSVRFVSVFSEDVTLEICEGKARTLSKKLMTTVLFAWIFDSDAVGIGVYQNGKMLAQHILNPDGYDKMGNLNLFCKALEVPDEDISRLRILWKKGDAEEQLYLTSELLGVPLCHDNRMLPEKQYVRDIRIIDEWIAGRPALPKIKSETKAEVLQELPKFHLNSCHGDTWYSSVELSWYDSFKLYGQNIYSEDDKYQLWKTNPDGTICPVWSAVADWPKFYVSEDNRLIILVNNTVAYDSSERLPIGYEIKYNAHLFLLSGGGILKYSKDIKFDMTYSVIYTRCAADGTELWKKKSKYFETPMIAHGGGEIIIPCEPDKNGKVWVYRVDDLTGEVIEKIPYPIEKNIRAKTYNNRFWYITHDSIRRGRDEIINYEQVLTKYDNELRPVAAVNLPDFTQNFFFSPDNSLLYIFFFKKQVMVVNAETLAIKNVLEDKSFLMPRCFDNEGRFWLQRDNSTIEAWDAGLTKTISRHKLKGQIVGCKMDENNNLCVAAWQKKEDIFRIYKLKNK